MNSDSNEAEAKESIKILSGETASRQGSAKCERGRGETGRRRNQCAAYAVAIVAVVCVSHNCGH